MFKNLHKTFIKVWTSRRTINVYSRYFMIFLHKELILKYLALTYIYIFTFIKNTL